MSSGAWGNDLSLILSCRLYNENPGLQVALPVKWSNYSSTPEDQILPVSCVAHNRPEKGPGGLHGGTSHKREPQISTLPLWRSCGVSAAGARRQPPPRTGSPRAPLPPRPRTWPPGLRAPRPHRAPLSLSPCLSLQRLYLCTSLPAWPSGSAGSPAAVPRSPAVCPGD